MNDQERAERLQSLYDRARGGIKPGLTVSRNLLAALGDPHKSFLVVHVAGTNGKGSTCAIIESVLRSYGLRTGLFTSPHLVKVNERFQVNGVPVSDQELDAALEKVDAASVGLERLPTFFEACSGIAFTSFAAAGVQIAVVETGMGGRWDSTNVVEPLVSVITGIGLDHMDFLGDTVDEIALEKAGIIKPGRPVVVSRQAFDSVWAVLEAKAREMGSTLIRAEDRVAVVATKKGLQGQTVTIDTHQENFGRFLFPQPATFQLEALTTAVAVLEQIMEVLPFELSSLHLKRGLEDLHWPARFQLLQEEPPVILDVAHNPPGAKALALSLKEMFGPTARGTLVVGTMRDKKIEDMLRELLPRMHTVYTVTVDNPRSESAEGLAALCRKLGKPAEAVDLKTALQKANTNDSFAVIAGSVYLAGEVLSGARDGGETI